MEVMSEFEIINDDFSGLSDEIRMVKKIEKSPAARLAESLDRVKVHLKSGGNFTNAQMDICAEVLLTQLPQHEREYCHEIAKENNYPIWLVLLSQWRRCNEHGEVAALLVDVDWTAKAEEK